MIVILKLSTVEPSFVNFLFQSCIPQKVYKENYEIIQCLFQLVCSQSKLSTCPRSRSLEPEEKEDLCSGLGADVFVLALGHALGPGPVLDGLGVGQLGRAQQRLEVLGLHGLDLLQVGGGLELPGGNLAQEPAHALGLLQLGDRLEQGDLAMKC